MMPQTAIWSWLASAPMILGVVVVATLVAVWQIQVMRRRRPQRPRRIVALLTMILPLVLLALGPARRSPAAATWLVTAGTEIEALEKMTGEVLILADAAAALGVQQVMNQLVTNPLVVPDAAWVARHRPGARLIVTGDGLDAWDWPAFDGQRVDRVESDRFESDWAPGTEPLLGPEPLSTEPLRPGIDAIGWSRAVVVGSPWAVEGHVQGLGPGILRLRGPGGEVDEWPVEGDGPFTLRAMPRAPGRWRYQLVFDATQAEPAEAGRSDPSAAVGTETSVESTAERTADGVAESIAENIAENLDIHVVDPRLPSVLWLESAPHFETRHFKSWWTDQGGALAVRTTTSRDHFRFERHNLEDPGLADLDLARLDADLLSRFDVMVTDQRYLTKLPQRTRAVFRQAIADGLGLFLLPGSAREPGLAGARNVPDWLRFETTTVDLGGDDDQMPMRVAWGDGTVSTALTGPPHELTPAHDLRPLIVGPAGRVLVAERRLGQGKVASGLVEKTFRWVLEGNPEHHRRFWSRILASVARPRTQMRITGPAGPVRVDEPLVWTVDLPPATLLPDAPELPDARALDPTGAERSLAWRQDLLRANRWQAILWPSEPGWYGLRLGDEVAWLDVQSPEAWSVVRQAQRRLATEQHALLGTTATGDARTPELGPPEPVARLPLFLLALAAAAFLWLDERLTGPPASKWSFRQG